MTLQRRPYRFRENTELEKHADRREENQRAGNDPYSAVHDAEDIT